MKPPFIIGRWTEPKLLRCTTRGLQASIYERERRRILSLSADQCLVFCTGSEGQVGLNEEMSLRNHRGFRDNLNIPLFRWILKNCSSGISDVPSAQLLRIDGGTWICVVTEQLLSRFGSTI